jgi:hypothetical protein
MYSINRSPVYSACFDDFIFYSILFCVLIPEQLAPMLNVMSLGVGLYTQLAILVSDDNKTSHDDSKHANEKFYQALT